ncbi:MAG: rod shape-determining protein [Candidatus Gastranaerophilales bacterium]|nr:rod shape-determining protein [Candidatus Gastranaerophilales bacterium]
MAELSFYEPADIEIHIKGIGMVLRDKSLIAVAKASGKVLAVGEKARIARENSDTVQVISPLRRGRIADYSAAVAMFRYMVEETWGKKLFRKPHITVCVRGGMTEVERKTLEDAFLTSAGKLTVYEGDLSQFTEEVQKPQAKQYAAYDVLIGIGKDAPEKYVSEMISEVFDYAAQQGISAARVEKLIKVRLLK